MTVDYLPIANGGSANVESQAQYVIDLAGGGTLANGYLAGLAKSVQFNKTLRQSSMVSAAVANYIANALSINVLDDGDLAALITNLTNAIKATIAGQTRISLAAAITMYVSPTGNDANSGLTIGSPKRTIGAAYIALQINFDLRDNTATIQLADGNYPDPFTANLPCVGQSGPIIINGHAGSSSSVTVDSISVISGAYVQLQNFKFTSAVGGRTSLSASQAGIVVLGAGLVFGSTPGSQISVAFGGGVFGGGVAYTINGGAAAHLAVGTSGFVDIDQASLTLTGTPAYSNAFASVSAGNLNIGGASFAGGATGQRYNLASNGSILTNGGGATYLPGNSAGAAASGGQYT